MAAIRLDSEERRRGIVEAAAPLFARKGFAGATTKEIAEAAGISEALLFRHFPTKAALYEEIVRLGCRGDPALEHVQTVAPSTANLVAIAHFMVWHLVTGELCGAGEQQKHHRLTLHSLVDDGGYAGLVAEVVQERVFPVFRACLEAAVAAGDAEPAPVDPVNGFWFGEHVASAVAHWRLGARPPHRGATEDVVREATWFVLRGIGLRRAAIERHLPAPAPRPAPSPELAPEPEPEPASASAAAAAGGAAPSDGGGLPLLAREIMSLPRHQDVRP